MATIDEQIEALETLLVSGTRRVKYDDKEITYSSSEEIQKALAYLKKKKQIADGKGILMSSNPKFDKGL